MTLPRSFLADALTVIPADDGQVAVTVLLPPDLVTDYCRFLESLADFFQVVNRKSLYALSASRVSLPEQIEDIRRYSEAYRSRLVNAFDAYRSSGLGRNESVKRVAADLRADRHTWSAYHVVRSELVAAGRGGVSGRPRGSRRGQS